MYLPSDMVETELYERYTRLGKNRRAAHYVYNLFFEEEQDFMLGNFCGQVWNG